MTALFGKLAIGHQPTPEHNRYLVMRFNFSKITVKPTITRCGTISMPSAGTATMTSWRNTQTISRRRSRNLMVKMPTRAGQHPARTSRTGKLPPVYLIIDEYDNFTNQLITAHQDALYREITTGDSFLRTFFKVIKAGVEDRSIGRTFITGVLPITIDDLTSGFNIAEIITLAPECCIDAGLHPGGSRAVCRDDLCRLWFRPQLKPQLLTVNA